MEYRPDGMFQARVAGIRAGALYWFRIDGKGPFPDPASRFQPTGVHGPSQIVSSENFSWDDELFRPPALRDLILYEMHIGTFTPAGTFHSAIEKLDGFRDMGINAIELMPIAEFAGARNWGYDGVLPYAPAHCYGSPDDLRTLVREAHRRGLAAFLDVVYNHLGPDGAYQSTFAPAFYSDRHTTPWGDALNFDTDANDKVRAYFIGSALAWIQDFHIDGLRVDATHAIHDDSALPFLTELTERVHAAGRAMNKAVLVIAEDERNERTLVLPSAYGGNGFDAVWSDDFHHHMRHRLAGDRDGYFCGFDGSTQSLAKTINEGWYFHGQPVGDTGKTRGTSPAGLSRESRVFCIQNHDQIGNRAFGERLSTQVSSAEFFASSAFLLLSPEIPLLFMGQEWAAPEPFLYFTAHNPTLGRLITEGRRKEFQHFDAFKDAARREKIPDPQAEQTFLASKLDWTLRDAPSHAACARWYAWLLQLRKNLLHYAEFKHCAALNDDVLLVEWTSPRDRLLAVIALGGPTTVQDPDWRQMKIVGTSEDVSFSLHPAAIDWRADEGLLNFQRPGAVVFVEGQLSGVAEDGNA